MRIEYGEGKIGGRSRKQFPRLLKLSSDYKRF